MDTLLEIELKVDIKAIILFATQIVKDNPGFITWIEGIPAFQRAIEENSTKLTPSLVPLLKAICAAVMVAACIWIELGKEFRQAENGIYIPFSACLTLLSEQTADL